MNRERILKQFLELVKGSYDYELVDCMPSLGMLTVNALAAADAALVPVQANYLSAKGLEQLLQTINKVKRQINPKLRIEGILLTTMVDGRTNYGREISVLIRDTIHTVDISKSSISRSPDLSGRRRSARKSKASSFMIRRVKLRRHMKIWNVRPMKL